MKRRMRRKLTTMLLALGGVLLAAAIALYSWAACGLEEAKGFAAYELWPETRAALSRYLWIHPRNATSHLLFAEALMKDESLATEEAGEEALSHLRAVGDSLPEAPIARLQEGRTEFFVFQRPVRAEQILLRAAELDPAMPEPRYLLWKLKDQTGRSHLAEDDFWKVYEASSPETKPVMLREWYMSQFFPSTANPQLDRVMGIDPAGRNDPSMTEAARFLRFRNAEPEEPLGYTLLARWFQLQNQATFALESLDLCKSKVAHPERDPLYLATLVEVLVQRGEFDRADRAFQDWPEPHTGYEYWITQGLLLQEVRRQHAEAIKSYDRALAIWPGQVDWRTMYRKADCLAWLREQAEATKRRQEGNVIQNLMEEKQHKQLRNALGFLDNPEQVRHLVVFYEKIHRPREAAAWSDHLTRLESTVGGKQAVPAAKTPKPAPSAGPAK